MRAASRGRQKETLPLLLYAFQGMRVCLRLLGQRRVRVCGRLRGSTRTAPAHPCQGANASRSLELVCACVSGMCEHDMHTYCDS
jgi:hypothetical protein